MELGCVRGWARSSGAAGSGAARSRDYGQARAGCNAPRLAHQPCVPEFHIKPLGLRRRAAQCDRTTKKGPVVAGPFIDLRWVGVAFVHFTEGGVRLVLPAAFPVELRPSRDPCSAHNHDPAASIRPPPGVRWITVVVFPQVRCCRGVALLGGRRRLERSPARFRPGSAASARSAGTSSASFRCPAPHGRTANTAALRPALGRCARHQLVQPPRAEIPSRHCHEFAPSVIASLPLCTAARGEPGRSLLQRDPPAHRQRRVGPLRERPDRSWPPASAADDDAPRIPRWTCARRRVMICSPDVGGRPC